MEVALVCKVVKRIIYAMATTVKRAWIDGTELRRLFTLMLPLYVANLMGMGMGVIDTIVAGRVGAADLAGVALGNSVTVPIMVACGVILSILGPMISRLRGAGQEGKVGLLLNNGRHLAYWLMLVEFVALFAGSFIFDWVTEEAEVARVARHYVYAVMTCVPASVLLRAVQANFEGYGQTRPAMFCSFGALLLNLPMNYVFAFGWGPIPAMGGVGCGIATSIIHYMMFGGLYGLMYFTGQHGRHARQMWVRRAPEPSVLRRILRLGFPLGMASLCELSFFCVVTLVVAPLGKIAVGAQQVAINVSGVVFMLPLSLGIAASIRAGFHLGAQNKDAFFALVRTAFAFALVQVVFSMAVVILLREPIISLYTDDAGILALAPSLLFLCALYQLPDALQALLCGLLRGCHDTDLITWVNLGSYWLVGFPLCYLLVRTDVLVPAMGPAGAWVSFIVALACAALCFALRFRRTARGLFRPQG